jgi:hypothetical protein
MNGFMARHDQIDAPEDLFDWNVPERLRVFRKVAIRTIEVAPLCDFARHTADRHATAMRTDARARWVQPAQRQQFVEQRQREPLSRLRCVPHTGYMCAPRRETGPHATLFETMPTDGRCLGRN